jgi:transposase-like protein
MQLPIELSHPCYHDEDAVRAQPETIRWPNGPYCPICGSFDRVKSYGGKAMEPGWYWCTPCRRTFTVRVGSIFERSHIPIHKWLLGFRLMAGRRKASRRTRCTGRYGDLCLSPREVSPIGFA